MSIDRENKQSQSTTNRSAKPKAIYAMGAV